ncbi:hypothetical protein WJX74_003581 [Apatococcus lobatus]|uniref:DNA polymerase kappa n=1 Tax=Apatococcus lobatus TaxID=904363 RepID=A0AAW1QWH8_9CHLO
MTDPRDRYNVRLETDEDAQRRSAGSVHHGGSFKKYMEGKNRKLREQFAIEARAGQADGTADPSKTLLRGISIHVNGFTKPSHQELRHLMGQYGGRFEVYYYRDRVTHIICNNLPAAKVKIFERERNPTPVLRPEWITDSIAAKRVLPTEAYLLWSLRDAPGQQMLKSFQPPAAVPSADVRNNSREATATAATDAAEPRLVPALEPSPPSSVVQRLEFSQPSSQDDLHGQQSDHGHVLPSQTWQQQQQQDIHQKAGPANRLGNASVRHHDVPASQEDQQYADSLPCYSKQHLLHEPQQRTGLHRAASVSQQMMSVHQPADIRGNQQPVSSSRNQAELPRDCAPSNHSPAQKQRLVDGANMAIATETSHPWHADAISSASIHGRRHRRQDEACLSDAQDDIHILDEAEHLHQESKPLQQPHATENHMLTEQGLDDDSCIEEQMDGVSLVVQQANASNDGLDDHHAAIARAASDPEHHPINHCPASAFVEQSAHDGAASRGPPDSNRLPPQQAAAWQGADVRDSSNLVGLQNPAAASCAKAAKDREQPGVAGADDAGMARARRLAAAARASCDVLRGPVRSSRDGPEFMDTYYRSSRLHFIGRWKARIEALQASMSTAAPAAAQPSAPGTLESVLLQGMPRGAQQAGPKERTIIHLDMDCFFASVAASKDPAFKGKPLAVCHSNSAKGTGEVSSANYEARAFGIKADMFIADAKRRCPDLIVMPYEFDRYEAVSEAVYRILLSTTACVQPISCDEAWLDVTGLGDPLKIAADVREAIWQATGCTASAGIGPNMLVARLATRKAKPNGAFYIKGSEMEPHLVLMPVSDLPGVGWSLSHRLTGLGISTVADLRERSSAALQRELGGKTGQTLWNFAHGRDDRVVEPPKQRRSVGAECNWGIRFRDQAEAEDFLNGLAGELCTRLTSAGVQGRTITLKLKRRKENAPEPPKFMGHGICDNMSRSVTVARFTANQEDVASEGWQMLRALHVDPTQIRGIGLNMTKLNTDPASAAARPGAGAPSRAAAPPPSVFGPHTMDNHPWGRIAQREVDGTFDPALGKEAMAAPDPPNQASRLSSGLSKEGMAAADSHIQPSRGADSRGREAVTAATVPQHVNITPQDQDQWQQPHQSSHFLQKTSDATKTAGCLTDGLASDVNQAAQLAVMPQDAGNQIVDHSSNCEHNHEPAELAEDRTAAGLASVEIDHRQDVGEHHSSHHAGPLDVEPQFALSDSCTMEHLPNRPRSPNSGQPDRVGLEPRQQAAPALRQHDPNASSSTAQQVGNAIEPIPVGPLEGPQPGCDSLHLQDADSAAANGAIATTGDKLDRQACDNQVASFDQAALAMAALSSLPEKGLQLHPRGQLSGLHHPQQAPPQQVQAQASAAQDRAPAPAAAPTRQLWGGSAARVMRPTESLPPASQLDASVLDALPLAMKRELEHAYGLGVSQVGNGKRKKGSSAKAPQFNGAKKQRLLLQRSGTSFLQRSRVEEPDSAQLDSAVQCSTVFCPSKGASGTIRQTCPGFRADRNSSGAGSLEQFHQEAGDLTVKCSGKEDHKEVWAAIRRGIERLKHQQDSDEEDMTASRPWLNSQMEQLAALATNYASSLVATNLEGLKRMLRQVQHECQQWPVLSAAFHTVIETSQALVKAQYGHKLSLGSIFEF